MEVSLNNLIKLFTILYREEFKEIRKGKKFTLREIEKRFGYDKPQGGGLRQFLIKLREEDIFILNLDEFSSLTFYTIDFKKLNNLIKEHILGQMYYCFYLGGTPKNLEKIKIKNGTRPA